ncbi:hypothetical protein D3C73_1513060 [compost metagenome]
MNLSYVLMVITGVVIVGGTVWIEAAFAKLATFSATGVPTSKSIVSNTKLALVKVYRELAEALH